MSDILDPKAPTCPVGADRTQTISATDRIAYRLAQMPQERSRLPAADCYQDLWLTVFFDGTGNNEKIDTPTFEHSNVARLYHARQQNDVAAGRFSFYVPGIGTPFREIGDEGGRLAMAVAAGGEARIRWAMEQIEFEIKKAAAKANNLVNKVRSINIATFGFSRGAATARAFARRIAHKCSPSGTGWVWKDGKHPLRMYFLGVFDTVASVGTPASARKYARDAAALPTTLIPVVGVLPVLIASTADGHAAWAGNPRIPPMVERCVHYCAAHEVRNSFPLDTVLEDGRYPANCTEAYYPGVHSNVGGGYRPGEGARNTNRFAMISQIPLKAMYDEAVKAGVPLVNFNSAETQVKRDFLPPPGEATQARELLSQRFNHYMAAVGWGGKSIGETVRSHMSLYFRWRIVHVGRKVQERQQGSPGWDAQRLEQYEANLSAERRAKQAELQRLEQAFKAAEDARAAAWSWYCRGRAHEDRRTAYEDAAAGAEEARWLGQGEPGGDPEHHAREVG